MMNKLSKHTVIGFFFLFLGTIELIGCGIIKGMHVYTAITDWLIFFMVVHMVIGYGIFMVHLLVIINKSTFWQEGQIKSEPSQAESEAT